MALDRTKIVPNKRNSMIYYFRWGGFIVQCRCPKNLSKFFSLLLTLADDSHRVRAVLSPVYVHGAGSLAAGELRRGKHTVGRHILYQELCRRLPGGGSHRAGVCHLCRLCQHAHSFRRRGNHDGVELSDRNYLQYACAGRADQRLRPHNPRNDGVVKVCRYRSIKTFGAIRKKFLWG